MKKIKEDALIKVFWIFIGVFSFFFISAYALLKYFLLEIITQNSLQVEQIMYDFNLVWFEIFGVALVLLSFVFYFLKKTNDKLTEDVSEIKTYLTEISEHKNYDAVIKIKHYTEFLELSLILKNIVKRLKQKEKKASKK